MLSRNLLVAAALGVGGLLFVTDTASAQRRGGGRVAVSRGAVRSGTVYRGGYYGGRGYYGGGYYGRGYYGGLGYGYGLGYGLGGLGYGYGGYGGYGYGGYGPSYYGGYAGYYPNTSTTDLYYSYYGDPNANYANPAPVANYSATVRVIVPDPNAQVWFDGNATTQTGTERSFNTPPLTAAAVYRIRATWMQNGSPVSQERTVSVSPGQMSVADFTRPGN